MSTLEIETFIWKSLFVLSSQHLIGEGVAHDEGWMSHGAAQVDQPALSQDDDVITVLQEEAINLRRKRRMTVQRQNRRKE